MIQNSLQGRQSLRVELGGHQYVGALTRVHKSFLFKPPVDGILMRPYLLYEQSELRTEYMSTLL